MATLTLDRMWLNLISTGAAVSAHTAIGRPVKYGKRGDVRVFAGGALRSITLEGAPTSWTFTLRDVTRAQIETLKAWAGLPVQVRDNQGRVMNGVFYDVDEIDRHNEPTLYEVPMTVNGVTVQEGV